MKRSVIGVFTIGIALAGWWATTTLAGPTITVGRNVPASQQVPVDKIDHSPWNSLLNKYVDKNGFVDYTTWKASTADQKLLDQYIQHLSAASFPASSTREAKLAFWINAYNAVTVKGILREYPTTSIRNHTERFAAARWRSAVFSGSHRTRSFAKNGGTKNSFCYRLCLYRMPEAFQ